MFLHQFLLNFHWLENLYFSVEKAKSDSRSPQLHLFARSQDSSVGVFFFLGHFSFVIFSGLL